MFTESDLRELLDLKSSEPILSLYLNTEPSKGNADAYKLRLRNLLKNVDLNEDKRTVENYFNHEYNWMGKSVAVFSCAAQGFFRVFPLALPMRDRVVVSDRPSINPLANLWENYGGHAVILGDKQGARLFYFHLGELAEQEGWLGELIKHIKRGGASSVRGRRGGVAGRTDYVDELVDRNMREVVQFAVTFFEEKHIRRILLGGTDENIALLRSMLPKAWQSLIIGTFPMSMTASHAEVLERVLEISSRAEHAREARLIENLITLSAKGGAAVTGLENTLNAAIQGRIQMLLAGDGYQTSGYRCPSCNILLLKEAKTCPVCNGNVEPVTDVVEYIVSNVLLQKGDVEIVHANPYLEKAGNIGAFLRY